MSLQSIMKLLLRLHGWTSPVGSVLVTTLVTFPLTAYRHPGGFQKKVHQLHITQVYIDNVLMINRHRQQVTWFWAGICLVNLAHLQATFFPRARVSANIGFKACIHVQRRLFCRRMGGWWKWWMWLDDEFFDPDPVDRRRGVGALYDLLCIGSKEMYIYILREICNLPFFGSLAVYWPRGCL